MKQSNFNLYVIADALDHFRLMDDPYEYLADDDKALEYAIAMLHNAREAG